MTRTAAYPQLRNFHFNKTSRLDRRCPSCNNEWGGRLELSPRERGLTFQTCEFFRSQGKANIQKQINISRNKITCSPETNAAFQIHKFTNCLGCHGHNRGLPTTGFAVNHQRILTRSLHIFLDVLEDAANKSIEKEVFIQEGNIASNL